MMTVSAAVRLMPSPPALVHSRNTNLSVSGEGRAGGREKEREREGGNCCLLWCRCGPRIRYDCKDAVTTDLA